MSHCPHRRCRCGAGVRKDSPRAWSQVSVRVERLSVRCVHFPSLQPTVHLTRISPSHSSSRVVSPFHELQRGHCRRPIDQSQSFEEVTSSADQGLEPGPDPDLKHTVVLLDSEWRTFYLDPDPDLIIRLNHGPGSEHGPGHRQGPGPEEDPDPGLEEDPVLDQSQSELLFLINDTKPEADQVFQHKLRTNVFKNENSSESGENFPNVKIEVEDFIEDNPDGFSDGSSELRFRDQNIAMDGVEGTIDQRNSLHFKVDFKMEQKLKVDWSEDHDRDVLKVDWNEMKDCQMYRAGEDKHIKDFQMDQADTGSHDCGNIIKEDWSADQNFKVDRCRTQDKADWSNGQTFKVDWYDDQTLKVDHSDDQTLKSSWSDDQILKTDWSDIQTLKVDRSDDQTLNAGWSDIQTLKVDLSDDQTLEAGWSDDQTLKMDQSDDQTFKVDLSDDQTLKVDWDDFCAVCSNGGELLCCERCPKVYHLNCHVPLLLAVPRGDWVCSLCRPDQDQDQDQDQGQTGDSAWLRESLVPYALSPQDQRRCERLTLQLLTHRLSAPFHLPVSPQIRHYYQIVRRPVDLSSVQRKLDCRNTPRYYSPEQFVDDVLLMFHNCAIFNYPDSEVAEAGLKLKTFFLLNLKEVFPERTFPSIKHSAVDRKWNQRRRGNVKFQ